MKKEKGVRDDPSIFCGFVEKVIIERKTECKYFWDFKSYHMHIQYRVRDFTSLKFIKGR